MTHRQAAAFGSPVFRICGPAPPPPIPPVCHLRVPISYVEIGLKDKKSWSEPDLSALWCEKVWFKVVGGQL